MRWNRPVVVTVALSVGCASTPDGEWRGDELVELGTVIAFESVEFELAEGSRGSGWQLLDGELPPGVTLLPDGSLDGRPDSDGRYEFLAGPSERNAAGYALDVQYGDDVLVCNETMEVPLMGGHDVFGFPFFTDFSDPDITTWVKLPPDAFDNGELTLTLQTDVQASYFGMPPDARQVPESSQSIPYLWTEEGGQFQWRMNSDYDPQDWARWSGPVPIAFGSRTPGTGILSLSCTPAPLPARWQLTPAIVGEPARWDFPVLGEIATYNLPSALPPGLAFDATTGVLQGTPTEVGTWDLVVELRGPDDLGSDVPFPITVLPPPIPATCGDIIRYEVEQDRNDDSNGRRNLGDPLEYRLVDLTVPVGASSMRVVAADGEEGPIVPAFRFTEVWGASADSLGSDSWPTINHLEGRTLRGAASGAANIVNELVVECEFGLRVESTGTFLVEGAGEPVQLEASGGEPPYTWEVSGWARDVELTPDGWLTGQSEDFFLDLSQVTVTDQTGETARAFGAYHSSQGHRCTPETSMQCGERVSWGRDDPPGSNGPHCLVPPSGATLRAELPLDRDLIVALVNPAATRHYERVGHLRHRDILEYDVADSLAGQPLEIYVSAGGGAPDEGWFEVVCD